MTIEDRARQRAIEISITLGLGKDPKSIELIRALYINISKEALENQWISVSDRLPPEDQRVLCRMKSNNQVVSGYITKRWHNYPKVSTDSDFEFEDYEGYECTHWMPEPILQKE